MAQSADDFRLVSPSIDHEGRLPRKYTQEGQNTQTNLSPPVEWYNLPKGTKSLALVAQGVDAPESNGLWAHWVVLNIPPTLKGLPEGFSGKRGDLGGDYAGVQEGNNDWKAPGWGGPLQAGEGQRIEFRLYALDDEIDVGRKVTKDKVLDAIDGHVLGEATFMALFD